MQSNKMKNENLLLCGLAAGPLFCSIVGIQMLTRDGFDVMRHPLSLLSLGDLGWLQVANFIVTGVLVILGAIGIGRKLHKGRGAKAGPWLIGILGAGLATAGVFTTDASSGFPLGSPAGTVAPSWHGTIHWVAAIIGIVAMIVAISIFSRRFVTLHQRGWARFSAITAFATTAAVFWPNQASMSWRFAVAIILVFVWLSALSARLITSDQ